MGKKRVAHRTWLPSTKNHSDNEEPPPSPPDYYKTKVDPQGVLKNSELPWEEKFCLLGGVPWCKIVAAQKYIYCHENVLKWDDSAAKDALSNAQERFYSMINSLPCENPLPDPDMYIDKIDWNPKIDPGLISGMDKEYFNPDEAQNSTYNTISGCNDKNKSTVDKPQESCHLEDNVECGDFLESKNAMNMWEQRGLNGDEASKDKKMGSSLNKPLFDRNNGLNDPKESTKCGNNSWNVKQSTNQNNAIEKIDSTMHSRGCRKRENQENTQRRKSQKHEGESQQFGGKGQPQRRYNLRSCHLNY